MRLIDADILIEKLKSYAECDWNKSLCAMLPSVVDDCIEFVDEQTTAYDIDNVVVELEKREEHYVEMLDWQGQSAICDAIEIVKHGGVYDNVCEYKIKDKVIYASCNNKQIASAFCLFNECGDYKYCPYCGEKIKVVE